MNKISECHCKNPYANSRNTETYLHRNCRILFMRLFCMQTYYEKSRKTRDSSIHIPLLQDVNMFHCPFSKILWCLQYQYTTCTSVQYETSCSHAG